MKFQAGERFRAADSGYTGRILHAIKAPVDPFEDYYTIEWDHLPGTHDYKAYTVETVWSILPQTHQLPPGRVMTGARATLSINGVPVGYASDIEMSIDVPERRICMHEYTTYHGLNETFEYCKHCDEKKK